MSSTKERTASPRRLAWWLFGFAVSLLLTACAGPAAPGGLDDSEASVDSQTSDVGDGDSKDADRVSVDLDTAQDGSADDAEASETDDGRLDDDAVDADSDSGDTTGCGVVPTEGCPCDPDASHCCLATAVGLECGFFFGPDGTERVWQKFYDCGCDPSPECEDYPIYGLCDAAAEE